MPILALEAARYLARSNNDQGAALAESMPTAIVTGNGILQRNTAEADVPDSRYWTAYDYYMIERDARAMRAAQLHAAFAKGWRALMRRLSG